MPFTGGGLPQRMEFWRGRCLNFLCRPEFNAFSASHVFCVEQTMRFPAILALLIALSALLTVPAGARDYDPSSHCTWD
jgi:hypothetical protein